MISPVQDWQFTADVLSCALLASPTAVPAFAGLPVTPPVQVMYHAFAGIVEVFVPVMTALAIETDVPPVSVFELRNAPLNVAVLLQRIVPETDAPMLHVMLVPLL